MQPPKMQRTAKGKRPQFYPDEPAAERVLAMVMALSGELAVVRERLDTLERLVDEKGVVTRADLEAFEPDLAAREERELWRREFLDRLFRGLDEEVAAARASGAKPAP